MLFENILETAGKTPLVRLNKIGSDLPARLYVKCEFFNPGGSTKDRPAFNMIKQAELKGLIRPGNTLIEPTSGNTGVGIALAGAVLGYKVIIVMPNKMSKEKEVILKALGAKIIRTPTKAKWSDPDSHISRAKQLQKEIQHSFILNQYANPANPLAHYEQTASEILKDLNYQVDMLVAGAGTGGSITGMARRIKKDCPHCEFIGADPEGSLLAGDSPIKPYEVEGIGYDFIPDVLDRSVLTKWVKTSDKESFLMARKLIKEEGILCGGSSGSALCAALQEAKRLKKTQNCVVILPDGVRNYMSKFLDDDWMKAKGFIDS